MNRFFKVVMFCTLACLLSAASLQATDYTWTGLSTVDGNFNDMTNWDNATPWVAGDSMTIRIPGDIPLPNTATISANLIPDVQISRLDVTDNGHLVMSDGILNIADQLYVSGPTAQFDMTGGVINKAAGTANINFGVWGGNSTVNMSGGSEASPGATINQDGNDIYIGGWGGAVGNLNMSGFSSVARTNSNAFFLGGGTTGTITMTEHASFSTSLGWTWIGSYNGGNGTLDMSQDPSNNYSTFTADNVHLRVGSTEDGGGGNGNSAHGTILMDGNTKLDVIGQMSLGIWAGGRGTMTMGGSSELHVSDWLALGDWGGTNDSVRGNMTMTGSSKAYVTNRFTVGAGAANSVGTDADSSIDVGLTSTDSVYLEIGSLYVGNAGKGIMNVSANSTVRIKNDWSFIGAEGGTGTVTTRGTITIDPNRVLLLGQAAGDGTWNQIGGSTTLDDKFGIGADWRDTDSSSTATLNISEGGLVAARQIGPWNGGTRAGYSSTLNADNGTLKVIYHGDEGNRVYSWLEKDLTLNILSGGLTIDTGVGTMPVTANAPLLAGDALGGGLTKTGVGVLTINSASTYTGLTHVVQGTLNVPLGSTLATTSASIDGGAELALGGAPVLASSLTGLTLNANSKLTLGLTALSTGANAINVTSGAGLLTLPTGSDTAKFVFSPAGNNRTSSFGTGAYTVVNFTAKNAGNATNILASATTRATANLTVNASNIQVSFASVAGANLIWNPLIGIPNWELKDGLANWDKSGVQDDFYELDTVSFTDMGGISYPEVNLIGTLHPLDVIVNSTANYIFKGYGTITGIGTTLTKNNTGKLTINNGLNGTVGNSFTGNVTINAGEVELGARTVNPLGLNNTITLNGSSTLTVDTNFTAGVPGDTRIINMNGSSSMGFVNDTDLRLGWLGGDATLNMFGTSSLTVWQADEIGRDSGSIARINMSDSSKFNSRWEHLNFGSNGGRAEVVMNGGTETDPTLIDGFHNGDGWWVSFGRDAGSSASLKMHGYSKVQGAIWIEIGAYGAHADLEMDGHATIEAGMDHLLYGDNNNDPLNIGAYSNASATVTMKDDSSLVNDSNHEIRLGYESGTIDLTMEGNAKIKNTHQGILIGQGNGSHADVTMSGFATIESGPTNWSNWGYGGSVTVDMHEDSKFLNISDTGTEIGTNGTATSTIDLYDRAQFSVANGEFRILANNTGTGSYFISHNNSSVSGNEVRVGRWGGTAVAKVNDSSTFTANNLWIAGDGGSNGTLEVNGNARTGLAVAQKMYVGGYNSTSQFTVTGSSAVTVGSDLSVGFNWGNEVNDQGSHTASIAGASLTVGGQLILGANSGKGTFTQGAGHTTVTGLVILGEGDYTDSLLGAFGDPSAVPPTLPAHGDAVVNLDGGILTVPGMTTRSITISTHSDDAGATRTHATSGTVKFNGGILQASAPSADFIATDDPMGSVTLSVLSGGTKIDTNGNAITITKALTGDDVSGRSLEVMSSSGTPGVLTLTGAISNIGPTKVDANATLVLNTTPATTTLTTVTGHGSITVAAGKTLNVTSLRVGSLAPAAAASAVPEPCTFVLLALAGLAGLLVWRRK